jgi:hypothetical protein
MMSVLFSVPQSCQPRNESGSLKDGEHPLTEGGTIEVLDHIDRIPPIGMCVQFRDHFLRPEFQPGLEIPHGFLSKRMRERLPLSPVRCVIEHRNHVIDAIQRRGIERWIFVEVRAGLAEAVDFLEGGAAVAVGEFAGSDADYWAVFGM